ncbi:MAG: hypothetical protein IKF90_04260, partial [Parasporobacterium sp.]|nr:hypothetical protein [Parasporobacterium sp.]
MELDIKRIQEATAKRDAEKDKAFYNALQKNRGEHESEEAEITRLLMKMHEQESERKQLEMEKKIEAE